MKQLIIGYGEVGQALQKILQCNAYDPSLIMVVGDEVSNFLNGEFKFDSYEVIHITFPYFKGFEKAVLDYKKKTQAKLVIIHSTVPIGTTKKLGAVHSPIRGVHPNLVKGIRTFVKYFGGPGARQAAAIFSRLGIRTATTPNSNNTEALKLWDTLQYGLMIVINKGIFEWCKKNKTDFNLVYLDANKTYNEGYSKLGRPEVGRPRLKFMKGKIGGHCIIPNAKITRSFLAKFILKQNGIL